MYAVIETGGKQYQVKTGDVVFVEKLIAEADEKVVFDKVIAVGGDKGLTVGAPYVNGATVTAKVLKQTKGKKVIVYRYKSKKGYHKKQGHRQAYTKLQIEKING